MGYCPKVKISNAFWEEHADAIAGLANEGVNIQVVEELVLNSSFVVEETQNEGNQIDTLHDLKEVVDRWVAEGKGDWPVRQMLLGVDLYMPLRLHAIVPGQAPEEGLELAPEFPGAPPGEHILILPEE